ncbi:MAG: methionine--tRNA ligase [Candidatus ainarchaeum sp.]|nr:methionine--tRNA ligase [Candidatus ainarchaeum sp.]
MNKKFYTTTAIPYVNSDPHMGHVLEFVQTDVLKRYYESKEYDCFLVTGADENSLKNVQAAEKKGISTIELCEQNSKKFKEMADEIGLSYDCFRRSSDPENHWPGVVELWKRCEKSGDIYKKKYKGLYCVGCEAFYTEQELDEEGFCPEHKRKPEIVEEENYFFKLSKYQDKLYKIIENDEMKIYPKSRKEEILNFIKQGLEDFSVSRTVERAKGWGVPVPGDNSQIMYVWFDALSCYITGVGFGKNDREFKKWWPCDVHIIGKGITRFHAIYWPAMLLSAGIEIPKGLMIHGYITVEGQKMSKSLGNVLDPKKIISDYGSDAVRYYLLKEIPTFHDGDFSENKLIEKINNELVANVGNLVNRVVVFTNKNFDGICPDFEGKEPGIIEAIPDYFERIKIIENKFEERNIKEALDEVMAISSEGNKYFQHSKPWEEVKEGGDRKKCAKDIFLLLNIVKDIGILLYPFMPNSSKKILKQLNFEKNKWNALGKTELGKNHKINEAEIVFNKIIGKKIEEKKLEFTDLDIEVGEVISAEKHPDAQKLFIEVVKLSEGNRQIVSGLADYFSSPEELKGKKVLILKNLKSAKIRGAMSQGMLLVAENKDGIEVLEDENWEMGNKVELQSKQGPPKKEITIDEFFSFEISVKEGKVVYSEERLTVNGKEIVTKKISEGKVR